jgi:hypothetical protein
LDRLDCQIEALPPEYDRTKKRAREVLANLRAAIQPATLGRDWNSVAGLITQEILSRLDMLADTLEQHAPEALPADGVIPELLAKLDDVGEAIDAAPFPSHVRSALRARLEELRWAAVNWHLVGADGVADAAGALTVAVGFSRSRVPVGDEDAKAHFERLFKVTLGTIDWIGRWMVVRDIYQGGMGLLNSPGIAGVLGLSGS